MAFAGSLWTRERSKLGSFLQSAPDLVANVMSLGPKLGEFRGIWRILGPLGPNRHDFPCSYIARRDGGRTDIRRPFEQVRLRTLGELRGLHRMDSLVLPAIPRGGIDNSARVRALRDSNKGACHREFLACACSARTAGSEADRSEKHPFLGRLWHNRPRTSSQRGGQGAAAPRRLLAAYTTAGARAARAADSTAGGSCGASSGQGILRPEIPRAASAARPLRCRPRRGAGVGLHYLQELFRWGRRRRRLPCRRRLREPANRESPSPGRAGLGARRGAPRRRAVCAPETCPISTG